MEEADEYILWDHESDNQWREDSRKNQTEDDEGSENEEMAHTVRSFQTATVMDIFYKISR